MAYNLRGVIQSPLQQSLHPKPTSNTKHSERRRMIRLQLLSRILSVASTILIVCKNDSFANGFPSAARYNRDSLIRDIYNSPCRDGPCNTVSFPVPFGTTKLHMKPAWFAPDSESDDDDDENPLVTREMFQRDMLQDPQVKRKRQNRKNGETMYKPLDNRDHLPFSVRKVTPDPYTHPEVKKKNASKMNKKSSTDLEHQLTSSRLYLQTSASACKMNNTKNTKSAKNKKQQKQDGKEEPKKKIDSTTLLGDFKLDKSTNSGDIIVIGDREYQVQKARSQYKYAGGQRFVMVRKILEVKEVSRIQKEEFIMQQYQNSGSSPSSLSPPSLE